MDRQTWRIARKVVILALIVAGALAVRFGTREVEPPAQLEPQRPSAGVHTEATTGRDSVVHDVVVRDESGQVVLRGTIDLGETLARIDRGERLKFRNDGSVFQNRERRLPAKAGGYYREWVHPTPKLSGPGPQRVVTGQQGEAWYTPDHYRSFERVR